MSHAVALLPFVIVAMAGAARPLLPQLIDVDGYLDRAPQDVAVDDVIEIRAGNRVRSFAVVSARLSSGYSVRLREGVLDYSLIGPKADVHRFIEGEAGERVQARFAFYPAGKRLLILELREGSP